MEVTVQQAHGVPLAWSKIIQVVAATDGCRVLDIARALSITVGGASKVVDKVEAAGFPRVTADLATSASLVGLTLTTFFLGMALGQLLGGPLSDQRGRRIPMIVGGLTADGAVGDPDPMKAIERPSPNGDSTRSSSQRCRRASPGGSPGTSHIVSELEPMFR